MTSTTNTAGLEVVRIIACHLPLEDCPDTVCLPITITAGDLRAVYSALVTAASAQARIAELEAERDQIAGKSIWWKAVIGDGEYTPSGEVPSVKHLHPAMVKPIYEAHKGTAVADVIVGLIFSRAITENREQFLVGYANARATAAEARADRLAGVLRKSRQGWANALELGLLPPQHEETAADLRDEAEAALQQEPTT